MLGQHLDRYQVIIARLGNNGVQVKTWCVTVLAAISALAINTGLQALLAVGLIALVAFVFLDAYYLALERHFRWTSNALIDTMGTGGLPDWTVLFRIVGPSDARRWPTILRCSRSLAISPFYATVAFLLGLGLLMSGSS